MNTAHAAKRAQRVVEDSHMVRYCASKSGPVRAHKQAVRHPLQQHAPDMHFVVLFCVVQRSAAGHPAVPVLCCGVLCCVELCCVVLCCAVHCTVQCCKTIHRTPVHGAAQSCTTLHCDVQGNTACATLCTLRYTAAMHCSVVQCDVVQCSPALWNVVVAFFLMSAPPYHIRRAWKRGTSNSALLP